DGDRNGMRVRNRAPNARSHARLQRFIRNFIAPEKMAAFGHCSIGAMGQVTGRRFGRARKLARGMRHLIARERAPPPASSRVEYEHQPGAQSQAAETSHQQTDRLPIGASARLTDEWPAEWNNRIYPIVHHLLPFRFIACSWRSPPANL